MGSGGMLIPLFRYVWLCFASGATLWPFNIRAGSRIPLCLVSMLRSPYSWKNSTSMAAKRNHVASQECAKVVLSVLPIRRGPKLSIECLDLQGLRGRSPCFEFQVLEPLAHCKGALSPTRALWMLVSRLKSRETDSLQSGGRQTRSL